MSKEKSSSMTGVTVLCVLVALALCVVIAYVSINKVSSVYDQGRTDALSLATTSQIAYAGMYEQVVDDPVVEEDIPVVDEEIVVDPTTLLSTDYADLGAYLVQDSDGTWVYRIQSGDTLTHLSAAFKYSVDEIAEYNKIQNVNLIYANSSLRVPLSDTVDDQQ